MTVQISGIEKDTVFIRKYEINNRGLFIPKGQKMQEKASDVFKQFDEFILNNIIPKKFKIDTREIEYHPIKFYVSQNLVKSIPKLTITQHKNGIIMLNGENDKTLASEINPIK